MTNWSTDFDALPPITLPDGRELATLADARAFILALSKREQAEPRWQNAAANTCRGVSCRSPQM